MQNQLHDFAPPIPASGLFWTIPIPSDSASIDFDGATASFRLRDLAIPDWGTLRYGVLGGPHVPSTVSFEVRWSGAMNRASKRNDAQGWGGEYIQVSPSITWSAKQEGFTFESESSPPSKNNSGVIGREQNGAFFRKG